MPNTSVFLASQVTGKRTMKHFLLEDHIESISSALLNLFDGMLACIWMESSVIPMSWKGENFSRGQEGCSIS